MCQLTFLQGESRIVKAMLGNLTLINANDSNKDGHGFYMFNPSGKYYRSKESGSDLVFSDKYWDIVDECVDNNEEIAVLSHVRSASIGFKEVKKENSHPFIIDNLVLAHNGTLEAEDEKYEIEDKIDSFWFAHRLATIVNKKELTPEHIAKAMEDFRGKFAFLIVDLLQPTKLFIAKGRTADLYYGVWKNKDDEPLCYAINTRKLNLVNIAVPMFWRAIIGSDIFLKASEVKEFDDESIYIWNVDSKTLVKTDVEIKERVFVTKTMVHRSGYSRGDTTYWNNRSPYTPVNVANNSIEKLVWNICSAAHEYTLSFSEINYLYTLMFGYSILFSEKDDLKIFYEILEKFEKSWKPQGKGKKEDSYRQLRAAFAIASPDTPMIELYEKDSKLKFPWWFNAKSGFKHVRSRVQSGNLNG